MKSAIWKYEIPYMFGDTEIQVPKGAAILSAGNQKESLCVWAAVEPGVELTSRTISCFMTGSGSEFIEHGTHLFIGTVLFSEGGFVVHVFEKVGKVQP